MLGRSTSRTRQLAAIGTLAATLSAFSGGTPAEAWPATDKVSIGPRGEGNRFSGPPLSSPGGRYVAFLSAANNLVPGDRNGRADIFVRNRRKGVTTRAVEDASNVTPGPNPFYFDAWRLGYALYTDGGNEYFVRNLRTGADTQLNLGWRDQPVGIWSDHPPAVSAGARHFAFTSFDQDVVPGFGKGQIDVFVRDRRAATTSAVSVAVGGGQPNGDSERATISADGRYVAFSSSASNLVSGDTNRLEDAFVHDRATATTARVSVSSAGKQANRGQGKWAGLGSRFAAISADGRLVAFSSTASNLVRNDTNHAEDVFVHDRQTRRTNRISVTSSGRQASGIDGSFSPVFIGPRVVQFSSNATNLVAGDENRHFDYFLHDLQNRTTVAAAVGTRGRADPNSFDWTYPLTISGNGRWAAFGLREQAFLHGPLRQPWRIKSRP
jgi:hypothetical protein